MDKNGHPINAEVDHVLDFLRREDPGSEEYNLGAQNLKLLCEARTKKSAYPIDPEVVLSVVGSLLGILLILHYERLNVISTRALSLIIKPK